MVFFFFINIFFVGIQYFKLHYSDWRWFQTSVPLFHVMEKVGLLTLKLVLNLSLYHIANLSKRLYMTNLNKSLEIPSLMGEMGFTRGRAVGAKRGQLSPPATFHGPQSGDQGGGRVNRQRRGITSRHNFRQVPWKIGNCIQKNVYFKVLLTHAFK